MPCANLETRTGSGDDLIAEDHVLAERIAKEPRLVEDAYERLKAKLNPS